MENYTWPNPSCSLEPIPEICHAIGVININWAWCETVHEELIADYLRIDGRMSRITNTMPNRSRSELLEALATEYYPDPMRRASVIHFVRWFDITRENRNLLTHSPLVIETPKTEAPSSLKQGQVSKSATEASLSPQSCLYQSVTKQSASMNSALLLWIPISPGRLTHCPIDFLCRVN